MQLSAILAAGAAATLFSGGAAHPYVSERSVDAQAPAPINCVVVLRFRATDQMVRGQSRLVPAGGSTRFKFEKHPYLVFTGRDCTVVDPTAGGTLPAEYYFFGEPSPQLDLD